MKIYVYGLTGNVLLLLHSNHVKVMKTEPCAICQNGKKYHFMLFRHLEAEQLPRSCNTQTKTHTHAHYFLHQPTHTQIVHSFQRQKRCGYGVTKEELLKEQGDETLTDGEKNESREKDEGSWKKKATERRELKADYVPCQAHDVFSSSFLVMSEADLMQNANHENTKNAFKLSTNHYFGNHINYFEKKNLIIPL